MNRKYLGSEISKEYVEIANQRIKEQCSMPLFESKQNQQYNLFKVDTC
jgi:DNA modification methylase